MEIEKELDFDEVMKQKEKRRISRERVKDAGENSKLDKKRHKKRSVVRKFKYDPDMDYDDYDYE